MTDSKATTIVDTITTAADSYTMSVNPNTLSATDEVCSQAPWSGYTHHLRPAGSSSARVMTCEYCGDTEKTIRERMAAQLERDRIARAREALS